MPIFHEDDGYSLSRVGDGYKIIAPQAACAKDQEIARLRAVLSEAKLQIEYLHEKFGETGSGNTILARIEDALRR